MLIHLLDTVNSQNPRFTFDAATASEFRSAISRLAPHETGPQAQVQIIGARSRIRPVAVPSWLYVIAIDMTDFDQRPWLLSDPTLNGTTFIETHVGLDGARHASRTWSRMMDAYSDLKTYLAAIGSMGQFAAEADDRR